MKTYINFIIVQITVTVFYFIRTTFVITLCSAILSKALNIKQKPAICNRSESDLSGESNRTDEPIKSSNTFY